MPSESDLRDLLRGPDPEGRAAIDLDAVLARARRRRRPKVVAAQALGSVALVGVLGTAIFVAQPPAQEAAMIAQDTAAGSEEAAAPAADPDALTWMPDVCGAPVIERTSTDGLVLEMTPLSVDSGGTAAATLTFVNTGTTAVRTDRQSSVTLSRNGIVVWHTSVMGQPGAVEVAPGESVEVGASFHAVVCESDEQLLGIGPAPENAPAGVYELRALVEVTGDDGSARFATGGPVAVEIR